MDIQTMKSLVRDDFRDDIYNQLLGFLVVENTIEDAYPKDYYTEGTVLVVYMAHTGEIAFEKLDDMAMNISEKLLRKVEGLAELGPVKIATSEGNYIITPPSHLPSDEDGWKLSPEEGSEEYYYSLEEIWEEIQDEGIVEIC